ncbi:lactadherin-like [Crotalus adamanteus]|uniref:Lactadherin-like n=1 Tax=Crotalus adamanteus TaxID=8729 RepID=A0AAW1AVZ0_CROAD
MAKSIWGVQRKERTDLSSPRWEKLAGLAGRAPGWLPSPVPPAELRGAKGAASGAGGEPSLPLPSGFHWLAGRSTWSPGDGTGVRRRRGNLMERPGARQLLLGLWVACSALSGIRGDFCDVNLCQNGGTCLKSLDESPFFCLCAEGFTGPTCNETEKGPCHPNPCKNKGECRLLPNRGDAFNEYLCICHPGYSGKHCQYNVNECLSQPCKNGGTCLNLKGHFDCKCPSPYVGKTCQMRKSLVLLKVSWKRVKK